ncbi:hypothetical protein Tco_0281895 [Tanacetum coccineum]
MLCSLTFLILIPLIAWIEKLLKDMLPLRKLRKPFGFGSGKAIGPDVNLCFCEEVLGHNSVANDSFSADITVLMEMVDDRDIISRKSSPKDGLTDYISASRRAGTTPHREHLQPQAVPPFKRPRPTHGLLAISTRPDLAYAVSRLSRHPAVIEGYSDANWISDIKDSRSLGIYISVVDHNSIRGQQLSNWSISIDYVKSKDNIADPLTKGLSRELVSKSSKGIELKPLKE